MPLARRQNKHFPPFTPRHYKPRKFLDTHIAMSRCGSAFLMHDLQLATMGRETSVFPLAAPRGCSCQCICVEESGQAPLAMLLWQVGEGTSLCSVCSARKWEGLLKPDCRSSADLASLPPSVLPNLPESMSSKEAQRAHHTLNVMTDKALHRHGVCGGQ